MKTNGDDLAIPSHQALEQLNPNAHDARNLISGGGLTKREYMATHILAGIKASTPGAAGESCAYFAVKEADELIKQLNTQAQEPEELK